MTDVPPYEPVDDYSCSYGELAELTFVAVFDRLLRRVLDMDACSVDDDVVGKPSVLLTPVALQTGKCWRVGGD